MSDFDVTAATGFQARLSTALHFDVAAATGFAVAVSTGFRNSSKPVSASTGIKVRVSLPDPTFTHVYRVSASTAMAVATAPATALQVARNARAGTSVVFSQAASKTRDAVASATTEYRVLAVATKNGRDVFVAATTGLGLAPGNDSNRNALLSPGTGFVLVVQAGAIVTATEAAGGFTLTHLAQAEVSLPWRRGTLSLPPGGQIPH